MSLPTQQKVWTLANPPAGEIQADTFKFETKPLPELQDGEVLIRIDYLSNDPAQRGWIQKDVDPKRLYVPPVPVGAPMRASGIATVLASKSKLYAVGDKVVGATLGWYDYAVVSEKAINSKAIELPGKPYASLSILGMVAVTAYQGIFDILKVQPSDTVIVSGAAGAVGSTAVQLAKNVIGAKRVVGIAGGKAKCDWVKSLGADECVDYKDPNFAANLAAALNGEYANKLFENVGGECLNTAFPLIARYGKIAVCGMIAGYNGVPPVLSNLFEVITNRLVMEGFVVLDFLPKWADAVKDLAGWIQEGKISSEDVETVVSAKLEEVPTKYKLLFSGGNRGKLVTALVSENSAL